MNDFDKPGSKEPGDAFDEAMRKRYRLAAASVAPATLMRLRQARHAASAGASRKRSFARPLLAGGAMAAVFAIAFGLNFHRTALPTPDAPHAMATTAAGDDDVASTLDQDPDFYAWLASPDADLVAME